MLLLRDHYVLASHIRSTPLQGESALCLPHSHSVKYGQLLLEIEQVFCCETIQSGQVMF